MNVRFAPKAEVTAHLRTTVIAAKTGPEGDLKPIVCSRNKPSRAAEGYGVTEKGSDCATDLFDETPSD
jgi:hypothetical protein